MGAFARLTEAHDGDQTLVYCDEDQDERPVLVVVTEIDGVSVKKSIAFKSDDARDAAFHGIDDATLKREGERLRKSLRELLAEEAIE